MLAKIIQQTVHTTKPPSNFSLKDDQLLQMLALRPPATAPRPPTPESKVTLWDSQRRCRVSGAAAPAPKDLEAFLRANSHMQVRTPPPTHPPPLCPARPAGVPISLLRTPPRPPRALTPLTTPPPHPTPNHFISHR